MIQGDRGGDQGQVPQRAVGAGLGAAARPGLSLQITDLRVILVFWDNQFFLLLPHISDCQ